MLSGIRVIDLTDERAFLAGKILGDLGADVIKVEPPGGDPARRAGPRLPAANEVEREDPERSLRWLALNTSKRGVVIDLGDEAGRAELASLVSKTDVLLDSFDPGELERIGISRQTLRRANPGLITCSVTPFGSQGPHAHLRAHDLVVVATGGNANMTGAAGRAPLRCSAPTSTFHAAPEAALGVLMALEARSRSGLGQHVDVSMQECQLATLISGAGQYALHGRTGKRTGERTGATREIWRAKDGWVSFGLRGGPARIPNLVATTEYMDECGMAPAWLREMDWNEYNHLTLDEAAIERLEHAFGSFFATKTMRELYDEALRRRILLAPCNDAREIFEQAQLRDRGLFEKVDYPHLGVEIEHPAFFALSSVARLGIRRRAPRIGEHDEEVRRELGAEPAREAGEPIAPAGQGVYAGLKILELGAGAAGPVATRYFAEHGATVVRIESAKRPDFLRMLHLTPENRGEPDILDRAPMFVLLNPNKQSLALDMKRPESVAIVEKLAAWADVVAENFAPGVMDRWGLGYESLRRIRPDLVMVSGCLFGQTGPQRSYPGFGGQGAAISGFNHLTGWSDGEALGPYATITDSLAPRYVATAVAAALIERRRSGRGQYIDVSQIETGVYSLSETLVRYAATGVAEVRHGNHDEWRAPHAVYPCAGDDRWIAIAVHDDAQWRALRDVMGRPDWAFDASLDAVAGRLARQDELDDRITAWTSAQEPFALMESLQAAGVEAGVVQRFEDLHDDPQLAAREHFVRIGHPLLGELAFERSGFRLSRTPGSLTRPGPRLGEHSMSILEDVLGLGEAEVQALIDDGVVA